MKREDLKALGLTDEAIDAVMGLHGKDIEAHKAKVTDLQTQLDGANKQVTEANATIEGFKKLDPEKIQATADEWKTKYEQAQQDATAQLQKVKFDHALDSALVSAKARNPKAVGALLSMDALKLQDDGSILGLKEQLEKIRTDNDYLFEGDKPTPRLVTGTNNRSVIGDPMETAMRKAAGLPIAKE